MKLIEQFLAGAWVRRFCGSGDRADETNWLHVQWQGSHPYGKPVTCWGFGSGVTDERIVFDILQRPNEWEISEAKAKIKRAKRRIDRPVRGRGGALTAADFHQHHN